MPGVTMIVIVTVVMAATLAVNVIMSVVMIVVMSFFVSVIVTAATVIVIRLLVVRVIVIAAVGFLRAHRDEVEEREYDETDAGDEHHRLEDAVALQILRDAAGGVEVQHHPAPQGEQKDAGEMNADA